MYTCACSLTLGDVNECAIVSLHLKKKKKMHSGNFYEMYVSVLWKYFNSGKDLGSEHITDLRSGLETLYSSLKK